jgi:type VI protein secretion system component Hcp
MNFRIQRHWRWLVALGAVFVPGIVSGALELPFTFKAGNAIKASEVNANFEALRARLDALSSGAAPVAVGTVTLDGVLADAPIYKFAQSIEMPFTLGAPGGKAKLSEIVVERDAGEGTPGVSLQALQGKVLKTAQIVLGNLTISLTNVLVVGVAIAPVRAGRPQEAISLYYGTIQWEWTTPGQPTRMIDYSRVTNVGGTGVVEDFVYGYFPPGLAADAAYIPVASVTQQMACATPGPNCKPAHSLLTVQKDAGEETLFALGLALTGKAGSTVAVDWFNDAGAINNGVLLEEVVVSTVSLATNPEGKLIENVGFGYARISWTAGNTTQGWDVAKNLPL